MLNNKGEMMNKEINGVMMQYFEWYLNCNKNLWNTVVKRSEDISKHGITLFGCHQPIKELVEKVKLDMVYMTYMI